MATQEITLQALADKLERIENMVAIGAKEMLSQKEAAEYMGYSVAHLYQLKCKGLISCYKVGKYNKYSKSELTAIMKKHRVRSKKAAEAEAATYILMNGLDDNARRQARE